MTDTTDTTTTTEFEGTVEMLAPAGYAGAADLVREAIDRGIAAATATPLGDHALLVQHPSGYRMEAVDVRQFEDHPRHRELSPRFTSATSLADYVNRYADADTLGYMRDATGRGATVLGTEFECVDYVLDDLPADDDRPINRRSHHAWLVLRPTPAARRWSLPLSGAAMSQVDMVELVIDGVSEIAAPPAAELRDLVRDLHAIRSSSARSLVRLDGGFAVEFAENVALHAGTGNLVEVPDELVLVLQPWTALSTTITTTVKIRPEVRGESVAFRLAAPHLEDALNDLLKVLHDDLRETIQVEVPPLWI